MEIIGNVLYQTHKYIVGLVFGFILAFSNNAFSACYGNIQRGGGMLCSPKVSSWERSDGRCNDSSECGPGKRCNSFGYCELCC